MHKFEIVSDGTPYGGQIMIDGRKLDGVVSVSFTMGKVPSADSGLQPTRLTLTIMGEVYAKGVFADEDILTLRRDVLPRRSVRYQYTEEACPGHAHIPKIEPDPKVCGYCGTHIDSLRPPEGDDHA